jgi:holliday junction DNA helicase RuvA
MIDSLNGELLERGQDHVVVDCRGVGYLVMVSASTLQRLPASGAVRMHVHYSVTVDVRSGSSDHRLFGFLNADERQLFRRLIDVQGVSATIGMAILGARSAEEVHTAVLTGNVQALRSVKGIGPKLAERIIAELQGKLAGVAAPITGGTAGVGNTLRSEALSALVSLGLDRMKAERALHAVLQEHGDTPPALETVIKLALKNL